MSLFFAFTIRQYCSDNLLVIQPGELNFFVLVFLCLIHLVFTPSLCGNFSNLDKLPGECVFV